MLIPLRPRQIEERLKTQTLGLSIDYFAKTTSTNDEAIRRAKEGGREGEIFIAEQQTAGRGRMGRHWESPAFNNLYLSFLLKPSFSPAKAPSLTLMAGAAAHEALLPFLPEAIRKDLSIKWPNDLYFGSRKIGGILTEMESNGSKILWVVTGIGMNLNITQDDFPPEIQEIATSYQVITGQEIDRTELALQLIEKMETWYNRFLQNGPGEILVYCRDHFYLTGKRVKCNGTEGKVVGLDEEGFLLIQDSSDKKQSILSGDIIIL